MIAKHCLPWLTPWLAGVVALLATGAHAVEPDTWVAVSWHDVHDQVAGQADVDQFAVSTANLAEQFDWIAEQGWRPVSVEQIIRAHEGGEALPDQAVLLTFDDGLASLYERVYPLLKAYDYPAVAAVVTGWLEDLEPGETIDYEGRERGPDGFVSWEQLREMADSGLVELASHSHALHSGVLANPQGNEQPAATTAAFLEDENRYETIEEWHARVRADLARSAELIEARTGHAPRTVVWPYGEYNRHTEAIARELGMRLSLGLTSGVNTTDSLGHNHRFLITGNPGLSTFAGNLPQTGSRTLKRAAHVDLDYVFDPDEDQQSRNLDALLDRMRALGVNTVYLQAFADPDGDGTADALYFPNRHLPVRADLFNRVAWQLRTRAGVEVYAWMPMLAFDLPDADRARALAVRRDGPEGPEVAWPDYRRLSPFHPQARELIGEIYEDLARHAHFAGILFHDDAYLAADEDRAACAEDASWPLTDRPIADCRLSPGDKTAALIDFSHQLTNTVRAWRPAVRTARNLYARAALDPDAEARFSQRLDAFLAAYDHTAIMAMPWMEGADDPDAWLDELFAAVASHEGGLAGSVFELQARDWDGDRWLSGQTLRDQMQRLIRAGAWHLAYYPDDFIADRPAFQPLFEGVSGRTFPYRGEE